FAAGYRRTPEYFAFHPESLRFHRKRIQSALRSARSSRFDETEFPSEDAVCRISSERQTDSHGRRGTAANDRQRAPREERQRWGIDSLGRQRQAEAGHEHAEIRNHFAGRFSRFGSGSVRNERWQDLHVRSER